MPIYEHQCTKCGEVIESLILNKKDVPTKCKKCGGKLKQIVSKSSFQLKGSGWYKSSYQKKEGPKVDKKVKEK